MTFLQIGVSFAALSSGVMAGVFFAFSTFIMRALVSSGGAGPVAMTAINRIILRSAFMPLFLLSTLLSVALTVMGLVGFNAKSAQDWFLVAAGLLYVLGMFLTTMVANVPLNQRLERDENAATWSAYANQWTSWNHVRTLACLLACMFYVLALPANPALAV